ncbi:MAG TPA: hypothetical protein VFQ25_02020 [Ktedonobacterales bacterium]|nr:hypothetical protein [Ktedonobacterales bacterium]
MSIATQYLEFARCVGEDSGDVLDRLHLAIAFEFGVEQVGQPAARPSVLMEAAHRGELARDAADLYREGPIARTYLGGSDPPACQANRGNASAMSASHERQP